MEHKINAKATISKYLYRHYSQLPFQFISFPADKPQRTKQCAASEGVICFTLEPGARCLISLPGNVAIYLKF